MSAAFHHPMCLILGALFALLTSSRASADTALINTASDLRVEVTSVALHTNIWGDVGVVLAEPITCTNNATHESYTANAPALLQAHVTDGAALARMYSTLLAAHLAGRKIEVQVTGYKRTNGQTFCSIYRVIVK
jgi:hypothetical protein